MGGRVRILVVDDHELVRTAICERLARERRFEVVSSAGDEAAALDQMQAHKPEIVLLDINLGETEDLDLVRRARIDFPKSRIVLVSALVYDRFIDEAIELGVRGYVSKREPLDVLIDAIDTVARGGVYYSAEVRHRLVPVRAGSPAQCLQSRGASLTPRQREILRLIADGMSKNDVAAQLGVGVCTIETHCEAMMRRLKLRNRIELTRFAIREGLSEV
jgi:DNA-binding NarL/FixJ family response regulator